MTGYEFTFLHGHCSDGSRYSSFWVQSTTGLRIDSRGGWSHSGRGSGAFNFTRRGKKVVGTERIAFRGRFQGDRVDGVLRDTFRSRSFSCSSGPVAFTAYRDGSARAPINTPAIHTARYGGLTTQGSKFAMHVFLPLREITDMRIDWTLYCINGYHINGHSRLSYLPINGTRFSFAHDYFYPPRKGVYERSHDRLHGRFVHSVTGTGSSVDISWRLTFDVFRAGRRIGVCDTGPEHFSAASQ